MACLLMLIGCLGAAPNPVPLAVESIIAGRVGEERAELSDRERRILLELLQWCEWRREYLTLPAPTHSFEIRARDRESTWAFLLEERIYVGQTSCKLPPKSVVMVHDFAERPES